MVGARFSPLAALLYAMSRTSCFKDDAMYAHNGQE